MLQDLFSSVTLPFSRSSMEGDPSRNKVRSIKFKCSILSNVEYFRYPYNFVHSVQMESLMFVSATSRKFILNCDEDSHYVLHVRLQ